MTTLYDQYHDFYVTFIDHLGQNPGFKASFDAIMVEAGSVAGLRVCDLACGEGHLSRHLHAQGAHVTGVDLSERLIETARLNSDPSIKYAVNNAETLVGVADNQFDVVFSHLAIMDIADLEGFCHSVHRVLVAGGRFFLTLLHPCFETPFNATTGSLVEKDRDGNFQALRVMRYRDEGHWKSDGDGVRGRVGAHHRMLSTYVNTLIHNRLTINRILEPFAEDSDDADELDVQWSERIPRFMTICCTKT